MGMQQLEKDLRGALERQEFQLYYQPKLDLASGKITGVEALIRWEHPEQGLLSPTQFIPLTEETNLISPIGEWVLRTACTQSKAWQDAGVPTLIMAVNLSVRQLYQPDFVESVVSILHETGLVPSYLELEITEYMTMDISRIVPILRRLKNIGIKISLDDFGIGYSSLFNFKELPIDIIKIDQCFVNNCLVDMKDATIVKAIIAMGHELNVEVVAEGIESKEQLIFLQQNLCDLGQGYLLSKPLPPSEFLVAFHQIEKIISRDGIPSALCREKWLQEALHKTMQELAITLRNQQGMTFKLTRHDEKFIHTLCDGELLYRMGLTPEQVVGKEPHEFLPLNDAKRKSQYYERAWGGEENVTYEGQYNGIWYLASLRPIHRGGQVVEVIGSAVDISDRIKKEREASLLSQYLVEQESKYRLIAENSQDLIAILDTNGVLQYASPSHIRVFEGEASQFDGNYVFSMVHPDDLALIRERWDEIISTKTSVRIEWRFVKVDGTCIWLECIWTPILTSDGKIDSILVTGREITERKVQERKLRESEQRYRDISERLAEREEKYRFIAENTQDLVGVVDMEGIILYASPSHELVLGFPSSEYEGNSAFNFVHPDDLAYVKKQFDDMVTLESTFDFEWRCKKADGSWVYIETRGTPIFDEGCKVVQCVYGSRDISERKKAEELLLRTEKLSVVGQMAAGVAHEFRNPLTSIKGFAQMLQQGNEKPGYIELILSEVRRLEAIVWEFLTLAKPQAPKMQEVDAAVVLQQAVLLFSTQSILNNIEIMEEHDSETPRIYCDENQIKQVFINILQNAVDAMPNGGIIKTQILCHDSVFIRYRFIDQGCGISSERIKSIGEPFYSFKEKGTGLGLMVSNKIVHEHGGSIHIESTVNEGTIVDVILPIMDTIVVEH
ncbi:EAL domain-containing protein [Cohnella zeiphila]|uniref:histidine kinase n=1 Tax=Cohnella zeiphila TaxID=2761120 RepID=A0A7X0SPR2_9BACL|nr:EAL domain-containing protein [Cohnella zeiphila]MBB6732764.1 EAL domain-containing protein [Cohnella zeiphila]